MRILIALFSGGLFGLGLMISGMTDTTKVQGFLDLFGAWDPTLVFVMGGAIIPMLIAWKLANRREKSFVGTAMPTPAKTHIDRNLVLGATLFGVGWGLSGFCPGPALASSSYGGMGGLVFLISMIAGMIGYQKFAK